MTNYAARAAAADMWGAACARIAARWTDLEQTVNEARRRRKPQLAEEAASEAFELCRSCPAKPRCRIWAAKEQYSGLAAGKLYRQGKPVPVTIATTRRR